jgi:hypothetical protein
MSVAAQAEAKCLTVGLLIDESSNDGRSGKRSLPLATRDDIERLNGAGGGRVAIIDPRIHRTGLNTSASS